MTAFIRAEGLLPAGEIDDISNAAPARLLAFQDAATHCVVSEREPMRDWIDRFNKGWARTPR